jgi:hypothetical protein
MNWTSQIGESMTMSTDDHDDNASGAQRKREVESYLRGKTPPWPELACAPRLHGWRAVIARERTDNGQPRLLMVLIGRVTGHPHIEDGRTIHTSETIWLDRNRNWARSWNRLYQLGSPADDGSGTGVSDQSES